MTYMSACPFTFRPALRCIVSTVDFNDFTPEEGFRLLRRRTHVVALYPEAAPRFAVKETAWTAPVRKSAVWSSDVVNGAQHRAFNTGTEHNTEPSVVYSKASARKNLQHEHDADEDFHENIVRRSGRTTLRKVECCEQLKKHLPHKTVVPLTVGHSGETDKITALVISYCKCGRWFDSGHRPTSDLGI